MFAPSNKCSSIFVDIMTFPQFTSLNLPNEKSFSRVANALLILYIFYFRVHFYDATKSVRRRTGYDPRQLHMPHASPHNNHCFKHYLCISTSFALCMYLVLRSICFNRLALATSFMYILCYDLPMLTLAHVSSTRMSVCCLRFYIHFLSVSARVQSTEVLLLCS